MSEMEEETNADRKLKQEGADEEDDPKVSPSGAVLKRLKLKVGASTLHITPGRQPLPEVSLQSAQAGSPTTFLPPVDHDNFQTFGKRKRQVVRNEEEDLTDSDSPPPVRKRTALKQKVEDSQEQGLREKRSPKPKVIWDPDESEVREMKDGGVRRVKGPEFEKKVKSPARDTFEEGSSKKGAQETLELPSEDKRERRLSKPKVIWDPDDVDKELLQVVNKGGPVSPQAQHASPKHLVKRMSKPSTGLEFPKEAPATSPKAQTPSLPAIAKSPGHSPSMRTGTPRQTQPLHSPHKGVHLHRPVSASAGVDNHDRVPLSPGILTPSKRRDALGSPMGVTLRGDRSPPGFKAPAERAKLQSSEQKDGAAEDGMMEHQEAQHGLASPGKKHPNKKRMREDTEAERQLKKEEQRRKRKAATERAAREVQASAIQKILGQESTRKKREEAVQKRRDAKEEERLASGHEAPSDMVRMVDNAAGVTVIWPAAIPLPSALTQPPRDVPPVPPTCAAPSCKNVFRYRDLRTRLPLCSLQCYKALRQSSMSEGIS